MDQFLSVWDGTYEGVEATGLNFHANSDGYTSQSVTALGWAGAGYCLTETGNGWEAAEALRAAIVASPDDYYLHLAMKSTDNYSHCFYIMGLESTKFGIGKSAVYDAPASDLQDFTRDGYHLDYVLGRYIAACTWLEALTGISPVGLSYRPDGLTAGQAALAQKAAHAAILVPTMVTSPID